MALTGLDRQTDRQTTLYSVCNNRSLLLIVMWPKKYTLEPFLIVLVSIMSCRAEKRLFHAAGTEQYVKELR